MTKVLSKPLDRNKALTFANSPLLDEPEQDEMIDTTSMCKTPEHHARTNLLLTSMNETKPIFTITVDGVDVGYKTSYKAAMRIVNRIKQNILFDLGFNYPYRYEWTQWKPKYENEQVFVLESWPINDLTKYHQKENEIRVRRIDYI